MKDFIQENLKLSLFLFFLLFLSGRIGLLIHEFAGHALSWQLLGGKLESFKLFLFGGGRVHFGWTAKVDTLRPVSFLFVKLSGVISEFLIGSLLAFMAIAFKTNRLTNALLSVTSGVLIVHSFFYLLIGAYDGSGDGGIIFNTLHGNARHAFLIVTFLFTVGGAFLVSFLFSPVVKSWTKNSHSKHPLFLIVLSVSVAVILHGTLTVVEQTMFKDSVYAEMKTSANDRLMEKSLSEFIETFAEKHGRTATPEEIDAARKELEMKYRQFNLEIPAGVAVFVAFLAGYLLSGNRKHNGSNPVTWKDNYILGSASLITAALIVTLNQP